MRIVVVTDSHLAPSAEVCTANWRGVRQYAARAGVDLTVHLGDITLDAVSDRSLLCAARAMCDGWRTPIRFLPGNHDVGDNPPGPHTPARHPLNRGLLADFRAIFGADFWSLAIGRWTIIGINAQLFGTDSTCEKEQMLWLREALREARGRAVALMLHKPLFQRTREDSAPHIRYVPLEPRRRLFEMIAGVDLRIVMSGHTHQYLDRMIEGVRHVWVPSSSFYLADTDQERVGEKITGLGLLELNGDLCRFDLVCPDGVERNSFSDQPFYERLK